MNLVKSLVALIVVVLAATGFGTDSNVGQSIADLLNRESGTDITLLADGLIKDSGDKKDLANSLSYQGDELWQVELTGKQLKEA